jgi:ATP-binding protein involved in chromosome partitioning
MPEVEKDQILQNLRQVIEPQSGRDIVSAGYVRGLVVKDGHVGFSVEVPSEIGEQSEPIRSAAEEAAYSTQGVLSVTAVLTSHNEPKSAPGHGTTASDKRPTAITPVNVDGIGAIIAVASGKGGVGKSTVAVNLAIALHKLGKSVGLLDADVYGPSLPRMMAITEKPKSVDGKILMPIEKFGVKTMSIGFLVAEDTPMIWRGPMVMSALTQMLNDVAWGEIDVLVVDMPPGTGDAQLTMAQRAPLAGAIIVSTPQEIALIDARKGLAMFEKTEVPILGIVENMAYFESPGSGERSYIFGQGGARRTAETLGKPFLGEIPLRMEIRQQSDDGTPIMAIESEGEAAKPFLDIAAEVLLQLEQKPKRKPPKISVS